MRQQKSSKEWGRGLYGIADMELIESRGMALEDAAGALLGGGAPVVQLRFKHGGGGAMLEAARLLVGVCKGHGAACIVNDRVDVALAAGADGVHLGQDDLSVSAARAILPRGALIGVSTHDLAQVEEALAQGADYIGFGPLFSTSTKANPDPVVGLSGLEGAVAVVGGRIPVVAIGGIDLPRVRQTADAGADLVAVISDILGHDDPFARALAVHRAVRGGDSR